MSLLLVTDAVGGVWNYSIELARALLPLRIKTVVAVMGPSPSAAQREEAAGIKLIDTGLPLEWLAASADQVRDAGEAIAELARRQRVDVVQACSAALLADARFAQPCVAVQHSCVASWWAAVRGSVLPPEFAWRSELVKRGLNRAAAIVAPSLAFAAATVRTYGLGEPIHVVHNGRTPAMTARLPEGRFVFTAGRLWDEGKNIATLDRAAARLDVPFQAAGLTSGPNGARIWPQHLDALGELGAIRLRALLAARPIYASAALYEPFGLSVLEAAQAGCALVLSDIPTHRELWSGAAVFVPPHDDAGFAAAIQHLLDNPQIRLQLGESARLHAQIYIPERMARGMADIYFGVATLAAAEPIRVAGAAA